MEQEASDLFKHHVDRLYLVRNDEGLSLAVNALLLAKKSTELPSELPKINRPALVFIHKPDNDMLEILIFPRRACALDERATKQLNDWDKEDQVEGTTVTERAIEFPGCAQPESRTIDSPSVLLTDVQTKDLLKRVRQHYNLSDSVSSMRETIDKLRMVLLERGWHRVELHGNQLLLTAVVTRGGLSGDVVDGYIQNAKATGLWSIGDYLKWGRRPVRMREGTAKGSKSKSFPDD